MRNIMPTTRRSSVRLTSAATQRRQTPEPEVKKFINIISLSTINKKMMKIPAGFVRLGPKLSDIVTLKTPAGFNRSIRIKRTGNEVWFENGWSEFAKTHSLSEGHLLLFHYKGNSSFRVIIFDKSASEIIYPLDNVHVIESDDDDDEQMVDVMVMDDVEEGIIGCGSSDGGDGGVIDLDELLKKKLRVSIKSEKVTILDDVVEIDSTDEE